MSNGADDCPKCVKGAPMWVTTFGDLMSLLLCFFVLLLSFSEMDAQKYKQVAGSMEQAFGVQKKTKVFGSPKGMKMIAMDFDQEVIATRLKDEIGRQLEEAFADLNEKIGESIEIEAGKQDVTIRLMGESTFDSGKAEIRQELIPIILKIGTILADTKGDVIVAGHTDNIPVRGGRFKSNLKLSSARAATVAELLIKRTNLDPQRLSTMGFGEYRPIESNQTPEGRRKNRRVEIIISTLPKKITKANT